jgi:hypothetical protein
LLLRKFQESTANILEQNLSAYPLIIHKKAVQLCVYPTNSEGGPACLKHSSARDI